MSTPPSSKQFPRYYAVNDRPVKVVEREDNGCLETLVFDWATGGFIENDSYFEQIFTNPFKDVDSFTKGDFEMRVQILRLPIVERLVATPISWQHTGDGIVPYSSRVGDRDLTIRINDFPEEPLYTLMFGDQEIVDLEDWPVAWQCPEIPPALLAKAGLIERDGDE